MFEQNLKRLEQISKEIEETTDIDKSLILYEEGCKLVKTCLKELEKAKGKIIMIKKEYEEKDENNG